MTVYRNFDQDSLEREYSPSSCIDDIGYYLRQYATSSKSVRALAIENKACRLGLKYGPSPKESLDLFINEQAGGVPLHVFVHGGYWQELSKDDSSFAATMFLEHGAAYAAINYTLAPNKTLTGIVEEVRSSIAWLYKNAAELGLNKNEIYVSGSSAGAHIVAMLLQTGWDQFDVPSDIVRGVCAVSGIYDLEPVRLTTINNKVSMDVDEASAMSPMRYDGGHQCPVIIAYGDNETSEFKRQSDDYRAHLLQQNYTVTFAEIPGRNHFDVILDLMNADSWLSRQVLRQMGLV